MDYMNLLSSQFNNRIRLSEKRPNVMQLIAPLYHEDGDMMDIFLELLPGGKTVKISDYGMTLMRLSYTYELDTRRKERILKRILAENLVNESDGNLWMEAEPEGLYPAVMQFAQVVGKVSNMSLFKRDVGQSQFEESLATFVDERLAVYLPVQHVLPIPERDDLEVDWKLTLASNKPVFMFGVRGSSKSRLVTISCLEFQKAKRAFTSIAVHEDLGALSNKDISRITSAVDKQFISIQDFEENGVQYLERAA